jgi:(2R)-ethylmalonyl-CoA mutase
VLAFETDLLEYGDIFAGSHVIEAKTDELDGAAQAELDDVLSRGGAFEAIDEIKGRLVRSQTERTRRIETGEMQVVGLNCFTESTPSPLGGDEAILKVDPAVEAQMRDDVEHWRRERDRAAVRDALDRLRRTAESDGNLVPATIALAHAGGTTGEWSGALREVFGEFRAPTGVAAATGIRVDGLGTLVERNRGLAGGPPKLLVAKPGLDGHSNGAEQIAVAARDAGMEVVYQGIRLTPEEIAAAARDEDVDVIGISILSGSHLELVPEILRLLQEAGVDAPVVVGGIIPGDDRPKLESLGVAAVYTPKDFELTRIMADISTLAASRRSA